MVKRIAPVQVVSFCLLAACGGLCQSERRGVVQGLQFEATNSTEVQRQQRGARRSLPDAPSALVLTQADRFQRAGDEARLPLKVGAVGVNATVMRETDLGHVPLGPPPSVTALYNAVPAQRESGAAFGRYLYPSLLKQSLRYQPSASGSLMGRATDAASRIFVTRDESGKRRLNTSYFLGVLTSVAAHSASRPYWARSNSAPFSDFGSTVGNDAGVKLLHEFGPGIRQMVTGHMPEFVSRIEERIIRDQIPSEVASIPAR